MSRKLPQSSDDLVRHLEEQRRFLRTSLIAYDAGEFAEAKRIATAVRVLVHNTDSSTSLLAHLGKLGIDFQSCIPMQPAPTNGPKFIEVSSGLVGREHSAAGVRWVRESHWNAVPFDRWWNTDVALTPAGGFSRKYFITKLANEDGGAHVGDLSAKYASLSRDRNSGFVLMVEGREEQLDDLVLPNVRAIGEEVYRTLDLEFGPIPGVSSLPEPPVSAQPGVIFGASAALFVGTWPPSETDGEASTSQ